MFGEYKTKIGMIGLFAIEEKLCFISLPNMTVEEGKIFLSKQVVDTNFIKNEKDYFLQKTAQELEDYFSRKINNFSAPYILFGTEFQKNIWHLISQIKYGETRSYHDLAKQLGKLGAVRAVGTACGANPIPIIVPCHRVIGNNGKITGYAGGIPLKKYLLELESSEQKLL